MVVFPFTSFPILETPRLLLRQVLPEDAQDLFACHSDLEAYQYDTDSPLREIPGAILPPFAYLSNAATMIKQTQLWFAAGEAIIWGATLRGENRVIGTFALHAPDLHYFKASLWYGVARPYWRQGIATEALRAILQFGFERMCLHRINVDTRMDHIASVRLLEHLGFHCDGIRRECELDRQGVYQSWGLYGILENEYKP